MEERTGSNAGPNGVGFKDEFHSRLKFNRRGLLGMANEGPNTNLSQFFLTFAATPELQGKNTLFGRVAGDTIYNLARIGEQEVDGERPVYQIMLERVEILINSFQDMVAHPRTQRRPTTTTKTETKTKGKKRKPAKQLLSFGDDEGDADAPVLKKKKYDERIVMEDPDAPAPPPPAMKKGALAEKKEKPKPMQERRRLSTPPRRSPTSPPPAAPPARSEKSPSTSPEPEPVAKVSSLLEQTNAQIAALKQSMKRNVEVKQVKEKPKSALDAMIPSTSIKGRKRKGANNARDEMASMDLLRSFQRKLEEAPPEEGGREVDAEMVDGKSGSAGKEDDEEAALCDLHFIANCESCRRWDLDDKEEEEDEKGWMRHVLSFEKDKRGKDLRNRQKGEDELVVIDPRKKARTLKEEREEKRKGKEGTGRDWDKR